MIKYTGIPELDEEIDVQIWLLKSYEEYFMLDVTNIINLHVQDLRDLEREGL